MDIRTFADELVGWELELVCSLLLQHTQHVFICQTAYRVICSAGARLVLRNGTLRLSMFLGFYIPSRSARITEIEYFLEFDYFLFFMHLGLSQ